MQETLVWFMIWEDPTWCTRSNKAHALQLLSLCSRAQEPQLLKPLCPRARALQWETERESLSLSRVWLFATPWTAAHQDTLSMEFSRQEYWSGCHFLLRGSSWPRDWTWVSHIAGKLFTVSATREAPITREATTMKSPRPRLESNSCSPCSNEDLAQPKINHKNYIYKKEQTRVICGDGGKREVED